MRRQLRLMSLATSTPRRRKRPERAELRRLSVSSSYAVCAAAIDVIGWGWLACTASSHGHFLYKPANSIFLSHKRISNDTNQSTEQVEEIFTLSVVLRIDLFMDYAFAFPFLIPK